MKKHINSIFCTILAACGVFFTVGQSAQAQRGRPQQVIPPIARAYQAWVKQGRQSGRFVKRCTFAASDGSLLYPQNLSTTNEDNGVFSVAYGDLNSDGVTDFIAHVRNIDCGVGTAGWHGEFVIGVSRGAEFSFGNFDSAIYKRYLKPLDASSQQFGFVDNITAIRGGVIEGTLWADNSVRAPGYCIGHNGNSNVRHSFKFDTKKGVFLQVSRPFIDRKWQCY